MKDLEEPLTFNQKTSLSLQDTVEGYHKDRVLYKSLNLMRKLVRKKYPIDCAAKYAAKYYATSSKELIDIFTTRKENEWR